MILLQPNARQRPTLKIISLLQVYFEGCNTHLGEQVVMLFAN